MHFLRTIRTELYKIYSRPRTYIAYGAILIIILAIQLAIFADGQKLLDFTTQNLQESFDFSGNLLNGYFISYLILNALWVHIPLLVALVVGDLLAGEANMGTFRLLLTRPLSRTTICVSKFIAAIIYSSSLVLLLGALSIGLGIALFGSGDLIVLRDTINIFSEEDILWRFIFAFAYGLLGMCVVAALAFLLSSLTDNSIGPIIGTMAVIIASTIFSSLDISVFHYLRPFLFTTYITEWRSFFDYEIDYAKITKATFILFAHIIVFFSFTLYWFNKKDILS
jgi:ABC-2 type transport system permease protein